MSSSPKNTFQTIRSNFFVQTFALWLILFVLALCLQAFNELRSQVRIFNAESADVVKSVQQRLALTESILASLETVVHIFDAIPFYQSDPPRNSKQTQFPLRNPSKRQNTDTEFAFLFKSSAANLSSVDLKMMPVLNVDSNTLDAIMFDRLRGYIKSTTAHYPFILSVTIEPRVERDEVVQFESSARELLASEYKIKNTDNSPVSTETEVTGTSAPSHSANDSARPFFYPLTFIEPMQSKDIAQLGVDKYQDGNWRDAINKSIVTQKYATTKAFNLGNERVFVLLKAVFSTASPSLDQEIRHVQAAHIVSITIDPSKLLRKDEMPPSDMILNIYDDHFPQNDPDGKMAVFNPDSRCDYRQNWICHLLPILHFSHRNISAQQPFTIETTRQVGWKLFTGVATATSALTSLGLAMLLVSLIRLRIDRQEAARNASEILFREKERALVTLKSINDSVLTLNSVGEIDYANLAALTALQHDLENIKGCFIGDVLNLQFEFADGAMRDPIRTCLTERNIVELPENTVLVSNKDTQKLVEGSISPLFDHEHQFIGAVLVFRDLGHVRRKALAALDASEIRLRAHQAELAHVTRLTTMGEMASGIAHEINQPLTAILSYSQASIRMLKEPRPDTEEIIRAMRSASEQSKRAGEIIARLRSFVTKKRAPLELVNVNQHIQNVLRMSEYDLRDLDVRFEINLAHSLPFVAADGIQLEQVVTNLIRNAVDAMNDVAPEIRTIRVTSLLKNDRIVVSVQDNGCGILENDQSYLFQPFFTTKKDGMGLGLTISTSIVESYGGQLKAHNLPTGGAEFIFYFPVYKNSVSALSVATFTNPV